MKVLTVPKLDWNADVSLDSNGTVHGPETISLLNLKKDKQNFSKIQFKQSENLSDESMIAHYDEKMKKPPHQKKKKKGANKKKTSKEEPAELNYSDDEDDYDIVIESVTYVD